MKHKIVAYETQDCTSWHSRQANLLGYSIHCVAMVVHVFPCPVTSIHSSCNISTSSLTFLPLRNPSSVMPVSFLLLLTSLLGSLQKDSSDNAVNISQVSFRLDQPLHDQDLKFWTYGLHDARDTNCQSDTWHRKQQSLNCWNECIGTKWGGGVKP